ncbi:hypothetical protein [Variovorax sp. GB1P17]|uniref:hypothetical protein n=1 Tax=Variovorax sp. GB1P17 TaxID=3443740 RepID=UPI003F462E8D
MLDGNAVARAAFIELMPPIDMESPRVFAMRLTEDRGEEVGRIRPSLSAEEAAKSLICLECRPALGPDGRSFESLRPSLHFFFGVRFSLLPDPEICP